MKKRFVLSFALIVLASAAARAGESTGAAATKPQALSPTPPFVFAVYPQTGYVGQARTLFLNLTRYGCNSVFAFNLDTTLVSTQNVVLLRTTAIPTPCPAAFPPDIPITQTVDFTFAIAKAGPTIVRWDQGGPDIVIQTVPARISSRFDVNGMWFDSATNGSGISIHHRRAATDVAFGTWFLFSNNGDAKWYALQSANWQQDGSVLEGLLIGVSGACARNDLVACPAAGAVPKTSVAAFASEPAVVRITFQSATRARAEVSSLAGQSLFSSELSKLAF